MDERAQADELARLSNAVAALQRAQARSQRRNHAVRRLFPVLLAIMLVALVPLATLGAGPFLDLNSGSPHNGNIQAIANAGITTGCNAPENTEYCPNRTVTREEMATFLARTAGLGGNPPIANAKTAVTAQTATNAQTLQGYAPSALIRVASAATNGSTTLSTSSVTPVLSVTLTTPGPGFVIVMADSDVVNNATTGCPCRFTAGLYRDNGGADDPLLIGNALSSNDAAKLLIPQHTVYTVTGAVTNTYSLRMRRDSGSANLITFGSLTALYIPFGYNGGATLQP